MRNVKCYRTFISTENRFRLPIRLPFMRMWRLIKTAIQMIHSHHKIDNCFTYVCTATKHIEFYHACGASISSILLVLCLLGWIKSNQRESSSAHAYWMLNVIYSSLLTSKWAEESIGIQGMYKKWPFGCWCWSLTLLAQQISPPPPLPLPHATCRHISCPIHFQTIFAFHTLSLARFAFSTIIIVFYICHYDI